MWVIPDYRPQHKANLGDHMLDTFGSGSYRKNTICHDGEDATTPKPYLLLDRKMSSVAKPASESGEASTCKFHSMPCGGICKIMIANDTSKIVGTLLYRYQHHCGIWKLDFDLLTFVITLGMSSTCFPAQVATHAKDGN